MVLHGRGEQSGCPEPQWLQQELDTGGRAWTGFPDAYRKSDPGNCHQGSHQWLNAVPMGSQMQDLWLWRPCCRQKERPQVQDPEYEKGKHRWSKEAWRVRIRKTRMPNSWKQIHQSGNWSIKNGNYLERRKARCATQGEKAAIIQEFRKRGYPLKPLLKAMGMARSTCYSEIGRTDKTARRNEELGAAIKEVFAWNKGRYGVRIVYRELRNCGVQAKTKWMPPAKYRETSMRWYFKLNYYVSRKLGTHHHYGSLLICTNK